MTSPAEKKKASQLTEVAKLTASKVAPAHKALASVFVSRFYRDVDADATLGTLADSDLGGGTAFRGVNVGANFRITHNLLAQLSYWDYKGFPLKDFRWQHVYVDLVADF